MKKVLLGMLLMVVLALGVGLTVSIVNSTNDDLYDYTDNSYLTLEERIILLEMEVEWQEDYIDMLEDDMIDAIILTNLFIDYESELRYIDSDLSTLDERYVSNKDELFEKYVEYILAEFPDYYSERSELVSEPVTLTVTYEDWTANVSYEEARFTLYIESIEVCNEVCEPLEDFVQTDYVMTAEELESSILEMLQTLEELN